jgi:hypothetical protein
MLVIMRLYNSDILNFFRKIQMKKAVYKILEIIEYKYHEYNIILYHLKFIVNCILKI